MTNSLLPGTLIKNLFERHGIYSKGNGCKCDSICSLMDQWGPVACRNNIDQCVNAVEDSYNEWKKELGTRELLALVPSFAGIWIELGLVPTSLRSSIRQIVEWAISQSLLVPSLQ